MTGWYNTAVGAYISGVALTDVRRLTSTVNEAGAVVDVMTGSFCFTASPFPSQITYAKSFDALPMVG